MSGRIIPLMFVIIFLQSCDQSTGPVQQLEHSDLLVRLQALDGVEVREIAPQNGYPRQFEIDILQPLDHNMPTARIFKQRLYLSHIDEKAPMVFMPSGLTCRPNMAADLSLVLGANQIYVAHRFMDGAKPDLLSWSYLNIRQAAEDHHKLVELFKSIYTGKWVSNGASKNVMTALFHRRFYPADVLATVTKVTPISISIDDPRYDIFLENVGSTETRERIKNYQRAVLSKRDEIIPMIQVFIDHSPYHFNRFSPGAILEYEMAEFPFSFWQVTPGDPATIPDTTATAAELYAHLESGGYLPYSSDEFLWFYEPVYYQAYTELGWYRLNVDHLQDLLVSDPEPSYRNFTPQNVNLNFDPSVMADVLQWLENQGNNIIYIYGANDPWTAGAVQLTGTTNALKIIQPNGNHYLSLGDIDQSDLVYQTLSHWLDMEVPVQAANLPLQSTQPFEEYLPVELLPRRYAH